MADEVLTSMATPSDPAEASNFALLEQQLTMPPEGQEAAPVVTPPPVEPPAVVVPPVEEPAPAVVPPVVEPPVEEEPTEVPPVETGKPPKPVQIRLSGPELQFAILRKNGVSQEVAFETAYGKKPEAEVPVVQKSASETELEELNTRMDGKSGDEPLFDKEINALTLRRGELQAQIAVEKALAAERQRVKDEQEATRRASEAGTAFDTKWEASFGKVAALYGDAGKEDGALGKAISAKIIAIADDPNHEMHEMAKAGLLMPSMVMVDVADESGIKPSSVAQATPAVPKAHALPIVGPSTTPVVPVNEAQRKAQLAADLEAAQTNDDRARILDRELGGSDDTDMQFGRPRLL